MSLGRAAAGTGVVPYALSAIGVLILALIVAVVVQTLRLSAAQNATEAQRLEAQACALHLQVESANRETCDAKLAEQNAAVDAASRMCVREAGAAAQRAHQVLRRPQIAVPEGAGPEVMNQWLAELLPSSP